MVVHDLYLFRTRFRPNEAETPLGWGYTFVNNSATDWLFVTDVSADTPFLHGISTANPFDNPVLPPTSSITEGYNGAVGLADLTWDSDTPVGFTNSGNFITTA